MPFFSLEIATLQKCEFWQKKKNTEEEDGVIIK